MLVSYTPLEPSSLTSLGVAPPTFDGNTSFYATTSFLYTLFFVAIIGAAFYRYMLAGILRMQASDTAIRNSNETFRKTTLGLLGVFSLFLILVTFNKDLVTGDIGLGDLASKNMETKPPPIAATPPSPAVGAPGATEDTSIRNDAAVRSQLANLPSGGIGVNKNVCPTTQHKVCTSLGGLHPDTISMLAELRNTCSGKITVSGGTEAGHSSHGPGRTPVDLSLNAEHEALESCIRGFSPGPTLNFCRVTYKKFGYTFCDEKGVRHWHVFK